MDAKYHREYYQRTKEKRIILKRESQAARRLDKRIKLWDYLSDKYCVDCGESDSIVLEFDHIRDKKYNISDMLDSHSWPSILTEIDKCEIRCANCHRRKTAIQQDWYKNTRNIDVNG